MTKSDFIKRLRKALRWNFDESEIADILADYSGFFDSGEAEGKPEHEISAELGDPAEIANGLVRTLEKKRAAPLSIRIIFCMFLTAVLGFAAIMLMKSSLVPHDYVHVGAFFTIVAAAQWLILTGLRFRLPPTVRSSVKASKRVIILCHAFLAALSAGVFFSELALLRHLIEVPIYPAWYPAWVSAFFDITDALMYLSIIGATVPVYAFYRSMPQYFTVIIHAFGSSFFMLCTGDVFRLLDDPIYMLEGFYKTPVVYGAGVLLTVLSGLFIHALSKRRAK
ncbi:MAG: DUF1700 domain-containing protein [Oscillospiraceae bacterium]|jgi:hypothetical protein|nr:DUF1700 domain-containing protein [Oscillospiraceae bacterium]